MPERGRVGVKDFCGLVAYLEVCSCCRNGRDRAETEVSWDGGDVGHLNEAYRVAQALNAKAYCRYSRSNRPLNLRHKMSGDAFDKACDIRDTLFTQIPGSRTINLTPTPVQVDILKVSKPQSSSLRLKGLNIGSGNG